MPGVQGREESCGRAVHRESVRVQRGSQGLGTVAHMLVVLGLDFGALRELEADPLTGLWLTHWSVFFARL